MRENISDELIEKFIEDMINSDAGFGELPYDILEKFVINQFRKRGFLPTSKHPDWEEVLNDASDELIDGE